jgi:hypothetical protein
MLGWDLILLAWKKKKIKQQISILTIVHILSRLRLLHSDAVYNLRFEEYHSVALRTIPTFDTMHSYGHVRHSRSSATSVVLNDRFSAAKVIQSTLIDVVYVRYGYDWLIIWIQVMSLWMLSKVRVSQSVACMNWIWRNGRDSKVGVYHNRLTCYLELISAYFS